MVGWLWRVVMWLFPAHCQGCGALGSWWCAACDNLVVRIRTPSCPNCRKLTPAGQYCSRCRPKTALTGILAGAHFREPLPKAVKALKYRHAKAIVPQLVHYQLIALARLPVSNVVLVPVPLHRRRLRQRGHNQAELLAAMVARATGLPLHALLHRQRHTVSQTGLSRAERLDNVAGAFGWAGKPLIGQTVVLVDDVATTGATLSACAVACRAAGARQVWGLVVAQR